MSELPFVETAQEAVESVRDKTRGKLINWLDHFDCKHCGAVCTAETEFVESQAMYCEIWKCEECESRFYRDSDLDKHTASMWDQQDL